MKRVSILALFILSLAIIKTPSAKAQLVLGQPSDEVRLHGIYEFILFNGITQTQTTGLQVEFSGANGPIGIVLPVPSNALVNTGKRSIFREVASIQSPKSLTQRKLEVSFKSYLVGLLTSDPPVTVETSTRVKKSRSTSMLSAQNRGQVMTWIAENGLYASWQTIRDLYELEQRGQLFHLILLRTREGSSQIRHVSPMIYLKRSANRPVAIPSALYGSDFEVHNLSLLADAAYSLGSQSDESTVRFRNHASKKAVSKLLKHMPSNLYTFRRAGYLQVFSIQPDEVGDSGFIEQRTAEVITPDDTARYDPLRIIIPLEIIFMVLLAIIWGWNRDKFALRRRPRRLKLR